MKVIQSIYRFNKSVSLILTFLLFFSMGATAQEKNLFNPIAANAELDLLKKQINTVYEEIVHWRKNLFDVPTCKTGSAFDKELSTWLTNE